ncbi:hypothetical protein L1887_57902 [Cichorium endivia]|nr:hypothetical protein L1887_57902 [Cichorium endivia]
MAFHRRSQRDVHTCLLLPPAARIGDARPSSPIRTGSASGKEKRHRPQSHHFLGLIYCRQTCVASHRVMLACRPPSPAALDTMAHNDHLLPRPREIPDVGPSGGYARQCARRLPRTHRLRRRRGLVGARCWVSTRCSTTRASSSCAAMCSAARYGSASSCTLAGGESSWAQHGDDAAAVDATAQAKMQWGRTGVVGARIPRHDRARRRAHPEARARVFGGRERCSGRGRLDGRYGGARVAARLPHALARSCRLDRTIHSRRSCRSPHRRAIRHGASRGPRPSASRSTRTRSSSTATTFLAEPPRNGLSAARMAALLTYRSRDSFESRFGRRVGKALKGGGAALPVPDPHSEAQAKTLDDQRRRSLAHDAAAAHNEGNLSPRVKPYGSNSPLNGYFAGPQRAHEAVEGKVQPPAVLVVSIESDGLFAPPEQDAHPRPRTRQRVCERQELRWPRRIPARVRTDQCQRWRFPQKDVGRDLSKAKAAGAAPTAAGKGKRVWRGRRRHALVEPRLNGQSRYIWHPTAKSCVMHGSPDMLRVASILLPRCPLMTILASTGLDPLLQGARIPSIQLLTAHGL